MGGALRPRVGGAGLGDGVEVRRRGKLARKWRSVHQRERAGRSRERRVEAAAAAVGALREDRSGSTTTAASNSRPLIACSREDVDAGRQPGLRLLGRSRPRRSADAAADLRGHARRERAGHGAEASASVRTLTAGHGAGRTPRGTAASVASAAAMRRKSSGTR